MKLSDQQSLLDTSAIEAAAIYNLGSTESQPKLRRRTDYITSNFLRNKKNDLHSFEQTSCLANRMTQLLDVLPGGVVVLDGNGFVQQCNQAAIKLLGEPIERESWGGIIKRAFKPRHDDGHDISLTDGRLVHISTSPLKGEPGQIILLQDVTETRQLQQKVSHLQRLSAMGEMAARLAHQIRTPLSSALLYLSPLLKEDADPKLKGRFAKKLHNSITHMEHLVKDMLAFSRGDMTEATPVSVDELLINVEQQFLSQPDAGHFHLHIENTINKGLIYGGKDALTSAVNNLVNNARLACEDHGEITIFADQIIHDGDAFIEISVEDNGVGIAKEDQAKVLTPFFTTRSSGTGLGLAVVKSIAKAHKGEVWFDSVQGEGSTFVLRLPLYQLADKFALTA
ncbi:ATP-binding protein [Pseudomonadota bacterium]|nr:ATP-binding protein [Pseudomonadota bacterium]